jgi:NADH-quinone oxidoreductase subunit H
MFHFWPALITVIVIAVVIPGTGLYLVLLERKLAAWMQDRVGPNRVGTRGLFQPIADAFKLLFKEQLIPERVDKALYLAAPGIAVATTMLAFAVVPFGRTTVPPQPPPPNATQEQRQEYQQELTQYENTYQFVIAPGIDIGIVFIFAVSSLTVYAVLLSGWSSNSKFSFIGGLRSSAQLISYEIPMGMSVLGVLLMAGSLDLSQIIEKQTTGWYIFYQPLAFVLFVTSAFAECNRLPFDLPEAEQELVAGYHTEYSALKFVFFYLGEYTHLVTTSFLFVILFFGGWHFPWIAEPGTAGIIIKLLVMIVKVFAFVVFYMLIRWTLPRFRFDQLMGLAWKVLIPLALANLICVMVVKELGWSPWWLLLSSVGLLVACAGLAVWLPQSPRVATRALRSV